MDIGEVPPSVSSKLLAHGVELDAMPDKFGWLQESDTNATPSVLRRLLNNHGYLYFRDFWPRESVQTARDSITQQLQALGFLLPGSDPDEARSIPGKEVGRAFGNPLDQHNAVLRNLIFGPRIIEFFGRLLGGEIRHFDYIWFRTKGPALEAPRIATLFIWDEERTTFTRHGCRWVIST